MLQNKFVRLDSLVVIGKKRKKTKITFIFTYGMDRDILDRIAAEETAETGVTAEEGPTRSRGAQYFLNASAELLDAALKKEEAYNKVPVTSALHFATNIAAIREAQVELLEDALQHTTTEADKCEFIRRAKILKLLGGGRIPDVLVCTR